MNLETLKTIYKNSEITSESLSEHDYLVVFDGFKYLNIPLDDLSDQEVLLLKELYKSQQAQSEWRAYLTNQKQHIETSYESFQCVQFYVDKNSKVADEWLKSFISFFENVIDAFYMSDHYGVIIVEKLSLSEEHLLGIIDTLDVDYSTNTSLYLGTMTDIRGLKKLFQEERDLFNDMRHLARISKFSDSFINIFVLNSIEHSEIAKSLRSLLHAQPELPQLIMSLWKHQGNQSAVAKEIFVHRNTINYRIDKLLEDYNLNLRDMDQLFICYILVK